MPLYGFRYNSTSCLCCHACQVACQEYHGLAQGEYLRRVELREVVRNGEKIAVAYSGACNHCRDPFCVKACPTGAMYQTEEGLVLHDDGKCIGCGACVWNCPYGAVSFSTRRGVSQKCDGCIDRQRQGLQPVCVEACPTNSLCWGDLEQMQNTDNRARPPKLPFLPQPTLTRPKVRVIYDGEDSVTGEGEKPCKK